MGQLNEYLSLPSDLAHIDPARLAHRGDPCVYCQMPHDDVGVGACPALVEYWRKVLAMYEEERNRELNRVRNQAEYPILKDAIMNRHIPFSKFQFECHNVAPFQRPGQWAFNHLLVIRPDLAERIRGTRFDPFHQDQRLGQF